MPDRSVCLVQERAFDDAGTGAITITLGDTPAIHGQKVCSKEGEFWHNDRLWASRRCTTVYELEVLLVLHRQPGSFAKVNSLRNFHLQNMKEPNWLSTFIS